MVVYTRILNNFTSAEGAKSKVHLYWGLSDIDRTGESQWDPVFIGAPVWDKQLDPTTINSQNFMIRLCNELDKQDYISFDSMECWMQDFKKYVEVELERTWPITSNKGFMTYLYRWIGQEMNTMTTKEPSTWSKKHLASKMETSFSHRSWPKQMCLGINLERSNQLIMFNGKTLPTHGTEKPRTNQET